MKANKSMQRNERSKLKTHLREGRQPSQKKGWSKIRGNVYLYRKH